MPEQVRNTVAEFLTPEAMAVIAGAAAVWAGSHLFGFGQAIDIIFGGVALLTMGWDAIKALRGFAKYYELAISANSDQQMDAAANEFATAMVTAINAIGWGKLGEWLGAGVRSARRLKVVGNVSARWDGLIQSIRFKVPRDHGMLWSSLDEKINDTVVKKGADVAKEWARNNNLVTLEMILDKSGFTKLYDQDFGKSWNDTTKAIWRNVSKRYVQSLEGKVTAFVNRRVHFKEKVYSPQNLNPKVVDPALNPMDPVLVYEVEEISKILLGNNKITEVTLIDVESGEAFGYRTRELLQSLQKLERKSNDLNSLPAHLRLPHLPMD